MKIFGIEIGQKMAYIRYFASIIYFIYYIDKVQMSNILVISPYPSTSHFHTFYPLIKELKNRGHNMTIITPISVDDNRINHIDLSGVEKYFFTSWSELRNHNRFSRMLSMYNVCEVFCRGSLTHPNFRHLLNANDTSFDLLMIELYYADAYLALAKKFNAPVIGLVPQTLPTSITWSHANPILFSYIPVMYLPFGHSMSLWERTVNTVFGIAHIFAFEWNNFPYNQQTIDQEFLFLPESDRDLRSLIKSVSLILVNSHYTIGYPRPLSPNIIEVAGIHLKKPKPLPKDLEEFMNNAANGVAYISFGTMVDPSMVVEWSRTIVDVFSKLHLHVIWKWKAELVEKIPNNFLIREWFPQNDILNHPNCKLFLTHGGIHSIIESINAAVPILGLPFFSEQPYNIKMAENLGIGLMLNDIEKYELETALDKLINDTSFQTNIKYRSRLFNERLTDPITASIFWVEHVIAHSHYDKQITHLKPASVELKLYQYLLVDVFLLLTTTLIIFFYLIRFTIRQLSRKVKFINVKSLREIIYQHIRRIILLNKKNN